LETEFTVGVGSTETINVDGVPVQPFKEGVTVTVATTIPDVALVAVNDGTLPVPLVVKPTSVVEVQLYVLPVSGLLNVIEEAVAPAQ